MCCVLQQDTLFSATQENPIYILTNSADPDEMPHYAAFHLGLHCLRMYIFTGIQNERVNLTTDLPKGSNY